MPQTLQRNSNTIKVLEEHFTQSGYVSRDENIRCRNCKERHYLIEQKGDTKNLFCTHCGALTPIRSITHSRGLAVPAIQNLQQTAILQPRGAKTGKDRFPAGIHNGKKGPLTQALESKGFQITDSQYVEPQP